MAIDAESSSDPPRAVIAWEAAIASAGILLFLALVKHAGDAADLIGQNAFVIAAAAQLYTPIFLIGRRGVTKRSLGLTLDHWRDDLRAVAALSAATIVPYAIGHHFWQLRVNQRPFHLRLPEDFFSDVVTQVLVVALAEELFFRGYLQERFERLWPAKRRLFGAPFGLAIIAAAAVFALAHFVGEYRLDRLGPFFPALLFGLLRAKSGTIVGAVGYHAFCNLLSDLLWASYR